MKTTKDTVYSIFIFIIVISFITGLFIIGLSVAAHNGLILSSIADSVRSYYMYGLMIQVGGVVTGITFLYIILIHPSVYIHG